MNSGGLRFEQLLDLYRAQRDARQFELAHVVATHADCLQRCRVAQGQLDQATAAQRRSLTEPVRVEALQQWHRYQQSLRKAVDEAQLTVLEAARAMDQHREQLQQAERRVKAVEKLAEQQRAAWQCEQARRATRQLDEAAARCVKRSA